MASTSTGSPMRIPGNPNEDKPVLRALQSYTKTLNQISLVFDVDGEAQTG